MKVSLDTRRQSISKSEKRLSEFNSVNEADKEPPGQHNAATHPEEEPPGQVVTTRNIIFKHIPDYLWNDWKWQFRNRITTVAQLAKFIPLSTEDQAQLNLVIARYPLSITPYYLSLINLEDPDDPIRKQAVPSILEITLGTIGQEDPLAEKKDSAVPGLIHRYEDRVLMVLTNICPMLCRHCTRKREWRHGGWMRTSSEIEVMLEYLRQNSQIRDVIISGGDPLMLSAHHLEDVISRLRKIQHIEIIRIGTRFPVVLPQRIDEELCSMLSKYGPIWLNTHFNHPNEITSQAAEACDRLLRSGVPVNNQSVLLRGVNDTVKTQLNLCQSLLKIKVRPYYLFHCDEVQGTEHLRTSVETGVKIVEGMRGHTSGLAIPTFVVDLPFGHGKVPLQPNYLLETNKEELLLKNYQGRIFRYRNPVLQKHNHENTETENTEHNAVDDMLTGTELAFESKGARDADRLVIRP